MPSFELNILGCGSALPTGRNLPSSQVLDLRNKLFMVDCGEGCQLQMRKMKLKFSRLSHIFISHLHGDHCFGLPGLVSTLGLMGRVGDLVVHAPKEFEAFLLPMLNVFCKDMPYKVLFNPVDPLSHLTVYEDRSLKVSTIPLKHRIPCCGYLFEEKPTSPHLVREMLDFYEVPIAQLQYIKNGADYLHPDKGLIPNSVFVRPADSPIKYAYCSDTAYTESIIPYIEGVDLLYHETTFAESELVRAQQTHHTVARQAAEIALKAGVKQLLIGHYSARYTDYHTILKEAKAVFEQTIPAYEGLKLTLK